MNKFIIMNNIIILKIEIIIMNNIIILKIEIFSLQRALKTCCTIFSRHFIEYFEYSR